MSKITKLKCAKTSSAYEKKKVEIRKEWDVTKFKQQNISNKMDATAKWIKLTANYINNTHTAIGLDKLSEHDLWL